MHEKIYPLIADGNLANKGLIVSGLLDAYPNFNPNYAGSQLKVNSLALHVPDQARLPSGIFALECNLVTSKTKNRAGLVEERLAPLFLFEILPITVLSFYAFYILEDDS